MEISNFIFILDGLCETEAVKDIGYLIGLVMLALKIAVPIILIIVGMVEMVQAITSQDENAIKKAGGKLTKKAVAAIAVFLIVTIVNLLMGLIGGTDYKECLNGCISHPLGKECTAPLKSNSSAE